MAGMFGDEKIGGGGAAGGRSGTTEGQHTGHIVYGSGQGAGTPRSKQIMDVPENKVSHGEAKTSASEGLKDDPSAQMMEENSQIGKPGPSWNKHAGNEKLGMPALGKTATTTPGKHDPA